jgi:hypothetical protein
MLAHLHVLHTWALETVVVKAFAAHLGLSSAV